jgi:hypothetical protein
MDTMKLNLFAVGLVVALLAGTVLAEETVKSGPQAGEDLAGPFHPMNINGAKAGEKHCLYCENGSNPVAMIFARDTSEQLTKLIKKLDSACTKNSGCKMASFVVFCSDDAKLEAKLKKCAKDNDLKNVVLAIDNPPGPKGYKVNKDADVTVVLYVDRKVKVNQAFKKGEMKDKDIDTVIKDLSKILPSS